MAMLVAGGCQSLPFDSLPWVSRAPQSAATAEAQVRQVLDEVHAAMQRESLFHVMGHVSQNYRDYAGIREYLRQLFSDYRNIRIVRTPPKIEIHGQYARVVESFGAMAEPAADGVLPINVQGQTVVILERVQGAWKILEWGPLY